MRSCIKCFKVPPEVPETFMGNLPKYRIEISFPFNKTGVDYGGPFFIKLGGPRSRTLQKFWIALFICMSTKAINLELVTDLRSVAFIAALRRFISRRGRPECLYSDN